METPICRAAMLGLGFFGVAFADAARADDRVLKVEGVGGAFQQVMLSEVLPAFAAKYHIQAQYAGGNPTDQVARMAVVKANPQSDVFISDDGPMYRAIDLGLCGNVESRLTAGLIDSAHYKDDRAVGFGLLTSGISYNTKYFADHGWTPPTSWDDLKSPRYKGLLAFPPLNNTFGVLGLVMLARAHGGGESDIEPGFAVMKTIAPNVVAFDLVKTNEMYQTGQIVISVNASARTRVLMDTGFPVEYVYPKEGSLAVMVSVCPTARTDPTPGAQAFIGFLLSPEMQLLMADKLSHAPVNPSTKLPAAVSKTMPIGENATRVFKPDWLTINEHRAEWDKRWTREIER